SRSKPLISAQVRPMSRSPEYLTGCWYVAAHTKAVKKGKTHSTKILGLPVLIGRDLSGSVFALRDFCPHRGMPLSCGKFDGTTIECCYHGWQFNTKGICTAVPSLAEPDQSELSRIKTGNFDCREISGVIWI